jgi:ferric-dicitrate binding protein FerR (iron transport regulator)
MQSLWGDAHGSFETTGTYAAATVLGTRWLTKDTCSATLITVATGEVRVNDLVHHRTLTLRAPHQYLAKP